MKVLLVGNYLPDRQDSMQLYAAMLKDGLRARGHEVRLLHPPTVMGTRVDEGSPLFKWLGYADKFLLFRGKLRRAAAQADIVHLCDHSNAMYVSVLKRYPYVVTCHDILAIRSAMGHFPENRVGLTGRLFQRLIARGLRRAHTILCVSGKTRDDLRKYLGVPDERLHVVANALNWPYAPLSEEDRAPILRTFGLKQDDVYFFHLGGNHWYKNRGAAIEVFAELRKLPQYAGTRLVMAGGRLEPALWEIARRHQLGDLLIEAAGPGNEQIQALYSGAIATLFPSLEEGFGWPIVESQACGCPVAIMARAPMNEVSGGAAIFIDPAQPATAAQRIANALEDTTQLRADGLRNAASYTPDRMLDQCEALYHQVITAMQMSR